MSRYSQTGRKDITTDARRLRPLLSALGGVDTYKAAVSADDTTPNYLEQKFTSADTSVVITVADPGADEGLDLSVSVHVAAQIATHAADADAHHPPVTLGAGNNAILALSGQELTLGDVATQAELDAHEGDADAHHNQSHVLATNAGLGADHTVSGLTARQVLIATDATTALFRALEDADIPASIARDSEVTTAVSTHAADADAHHNWPLLDADIPSTIARDSEVTSAISTHASDANAHHNRSHAITSASDHTVTGAALDVVGLTATNTLGILTPSAAVSTAVSALLKTDSNGRFRVQGLGIGAAAGADAITMGDDTWIGLGASAARIVFDNQTADQIEVRDALVILNSDTPDSAISGVNMQSIDGAIGVSYSGDNAALRLYSYGTGVNAGVQARTARGTRSSPTATQSEDTLARYGGGGHTGSAFSTENTAFMQAHASQNWTPSNNGSDLRFYTTPNNSTTAVERGRWANGGALHLIDAAVAHGITDQAPTNVYGELGPRTSDAGGFEVTGYRDADNVAGEALALVGRLGESGDTSKTTGALGIVTVIAQIKSGSNAGAAGVNENLLTVRNSTTTRWILDAEGDTHRDGTDNTYDTYHDAHLARAFDRAVSPGSVIDSDFDSWVQYGREDLVKAGILHESGFYNESRLLRLAIGAVWQEYTERQRLAARVMDLERRMLNA